MLPDYGALELAASDMGAIVPGVPRAGRFGSRRMRLVRRQGTLPEGVVRPRFGFGPGGSKQPAGSRVLGPAPFPSGFPSPFTRSTSTPTRGYRVPTLRAATASSPYLSSAYRRPQGQTAASSYWATTPGYMRAYSPAQSYMPAFNVQQYSPIVPQAGQPRMGRRMRRLYRLLMKAKQKGFRHWKVRSRRGRMVNRISRKPYAKRRSKLAKKIAMLSKALSRRGRRRQVINLKRKVFGKPQRVGRAMRQIGRNTQSLAGAYWGDLGNVGLGPGMF